MRLAIANYRKAKKLLRASEVQILHLIELKHRSRPEQKLPWNAPRDLRNVRPGANMFDLTQGKGKCVVFPFFQTTSEHRGNRRCSRLLTNFAPSAGRPQQIEGSHFSTSFFVQKSMNLHRRRPRSAKFALIQRCAGISRYL
jgi:hypothetical protein